MGRIPAVRRSHGGALSARQSGSDCQSESQSIKSLLTRLQSLASGCFPSCQGPCDEKEDGGDCGSLFQVLKGLTLEKRLFHVPIPMQIPKVFDT